MSDKKQYELEKNKQRLDYLFDSGIDFDRRIIQLTGPIIDGVFDFIDAAVTELEAKSRKAITIKINSPGGSVYDALAVVGRLTSSKCQIITEAYGHVMSAATLILAAGDKRRMSKYAFFMHHQSSYVVGGSHAEVKEEVEQMEREEKLWAKWLAELTTKKEDFWFKQSHKKNFYLDAEECLNYGIIDEII